jgi:PqqD family protein of HPr-rel-A system
MTARPVRLRRSVRVRLGADRGFLFDERSGRVYSLNATAALAAAGLRDEKAEAEIVTSVTEEFAVEAAVARRDLERFIEQLVQEGLATRG